MWKPLLLFAALVSSPVSLAAAEPGSVCPPGLPVVEVQGYGVAQPLAAELRDVAVTRYREVAAAVGADDCRPIRVELTAELEDAAAHGLDWHVPAWAIGAARGHERRILLTVHRDGQRHDRETVLTHELVHVAVDAARGGAPVPLWFHEGVARTLAGEHGARDAELLAGARLADRIPGLEGLSRHFPTQDGDASLAYATSGRAVSLVVEREGEGVIARLLDRASGGQPFEEALAEEVGMRSWQLSLRVEESVPRLTALLSVLRQAEVSWALAGLLAALAFYKLRRKQRKAIAAMPSYDLPEQGLVV